MEYTNFSANCPISTPLYSPDEELFYFNGFAWSNAVGLILQSNTLSVQDPGQWFGTQQ